MQNSLNIGALDDMIDYCLYKNRPALNQELIKEIHPDINVSYNSLNIAVGRQRSGKTQCIIREIIKISNVCPRTHLLVYINKDGLQNDPTFESLKPLIKIPIIYVSEDKAEESVKELLKWKHFYNDIKKNHWEDKIVDRQVAEVFKKLYINNFNNLTLHTILFFEDSANCSLFKKPTNYFNQLFTKLAHIQCSVFFAVQFWKSLPSEVKANVSTVFIFPNFSRQQLSFMLAQVPLPYTKEQIYAVYQKLSEHQKLIVDVNNQKIKIE